MGRRVALAAFLAACLTLVPAVAHATPGPQPDGFGGPPEFLPGAPGAGDPYFPLDGNGGYDVQHYLLDVDYDPATDVLTGVATITARATQNLSSFNLDFEGLTVRSITVNGATGRVEPRRRRADRHARDAGCAKAAASPPW